MTVVASGAEGPHVRILPGRAKFFENGELRAKQELGHLRPGANGFMVRAPPRCQCPSEPRHHSSAAIRLDDIAGMRDDSRGRPRGAGANEHE
jgi:hypothetical protein